MQNRHRRFSVRRLLVILFVSSLIICLSFNYYHPSNALQPTASQISQITTAQPPDVRQLVQQGIERYRSGDVAGAIAFWETALNAYQSAENLENRAIVLEKLAIAYQQIGQFEQAINHWKEAIANSRQRGDFIKQGRLLTELAQTYGKLGLNREAIALLCGAIETDDDCLESEGSALEIARKFGDRPGEAAALGSLGEAYRIRGKYDQAIKILESSLKISLEINLPIYQFSALNSLGNVYFSKAQLNEQRANSARFRNAENKANEFIKEANFDYKKALESFQNSLELAQTQKHQSGQMRVLLNLIQLYSYPKDLNLPDSTKRAEQVWKDAFTLLETLPDSPNKVYAAIDLAEFEQPVFSNDSTFFPAQCSSIKSENSKAEELFKKAVYIAKTIQDNRSESFALGKLGHLYECRKDYDKALQLTQEARLTADQNLRAKDSLYLWEWQAGRILKAQGKELEAMAAYERAIAILEAEGGIRDNLLIAERDLQFNFQDSISPLYREFARLKLERAESLPLESKEYQKELDSALDTIDSLKLAELQNYFGNDCVFEVFDKERIDNLESEDTAVFSSIIFEDRTAIVASLPNFKREINPNINRLKTFRWIEVDSQTFRKQIENFRQALEAYFELSGNFLTLGEELYNDLIAPFVSELNSAQIKTLIFVQDGLLRSIPMAALYDGEQFLVEKYAIATTPGLRLTSPQPFNLGNLRTLALGLTEAAIVDGEKFAALENVAAELNQIIELFPGSKKLLNEEFTRESFKQELEQTVYPIIHIATHGQFGTIPEDTFLVTGNNDKITITDLESDIRLLSESLEPLELLALTACQTGVGDDRTTLGLAGITVQAGVRSALASLWYVDDISTQELVTQFYNNLRSPMSKAEALKEAQKMLIDRKIHPARWAPFILIGNWL
ncbi:CHAT domain-containing protein [Capilliphycus salinus ALCB114379]|uniref:CHAT domain-containing protein n=1 Tax=Capilliphycus salinus TaxID=2768948 RepID=UPI0039A5F732